MLITTSGRISTPSSLVIQLRPANTPDQGSCFVAVVAAEVGIWWSVAVVVIAGIINVGVVTTCARSVGTGSRE